MEGKVAGYYESEKAQGKANYVVEETIVTGSRVDALRGSMGLCNHTVQTIVVKLSFAT